MRKRIERAVFESQRCFTCGSSVYFAEQKMTAKHIYHNRCFKCRICRRILNTLSLNEEGDDIYCSNCYRKKQIGDCDSFAFRRAAAEKAALVYLTRHPNLPLPFSTTRSISTNRLSHQLLSEVHRLEPRSRSEEKKKTISKTQPIKEPINIPILFNSGFKPRPLDIPDSSMRSNSIPPSFDRSRSSMSLHFSPVPPSATDSPRKSSLSSITGSNVSSSSNREPFSEVGTPQIKKRVNFDFQGSTFDDRKRFNAGSRLPEENRKFVFPDATLTPLRRRFSRVDFHRPTRLRKIAE